MSNLVPEGVYCVGIPAPLLAQGMTELSSSELRVLLYIYLHTLGYKKTEDNISYEQFLSGVKKRDGEQLDQGAGISRRALVTALTGLEQKGYIQRVHTGAKFALGTKIRLSFTAKEFQIKEREVEQVQISKNILGKHPKANKPNPNNTSNIVQKGASKKVQNLHPSCNNQHVINHDDDDDDDKTNNFGVTQEKLPQPHNTQFQEAVKYICENITALAEVEAKQLVTTALYKNNRNLDYLKNLVQYILSRPKICSPAAVLAMLIKNNYEREFSKQTRKSSSQLANSISNPAQNRSVRKTLTFPYAMQHLLQKGTRTPQPEPVITTLKTAKKGVVQAVKLPGGKSKISRKINTVQTSFDWGLDTLQGEGQETTHPIADNLTLPYLLAVTTEVAEESGETLASLSSTPVQNSTEEVLAGDLLAQYLREDMAGRLKYGLSNSLSEMLKTVVIGVERAAHAPVVRVNFNNNLAERLLTQRDYNAIRLSLRQKLAGATYAIEVLCAGEEVGKIPTENNLYQAYLAKPAAAYPHSFAG